MHDCHARRTTDKIQESYTRETDLPDILLQAVVEDQGLARVQHVPCQRALPQHRDLVSKLLSHLEGMHPPVPSLLPPQNELQRQQAL